MEKQGELLRTPQQHGFVIPAETPVQSSPETVRDLFGVLFRNLRVIRTLSS